MSQRVPMTLEGAEKLREELHRLKTVDRKEVIEAIAEARAHGDLKENAEYHAAKEKQGFIEARIRDIEGKLSHAQIVDVTKMHNEGRVIFGATVSLVNLEDDSHVKYRIVGEDEANIEEGKISISSPVARALVGKSVGDVADVRAPNGIIAYEIEEVQYI